MNSSFEHQCDKCLATIRRGDPVKQERVNDALVWVHMDCRGRFEREIGINEESKPAPKVWASRPPCPQCGALMARDGSGYVCGMHVPPIYTDGESR